MNQSPRFLIIQTAFIGDVILATSLIEKLHHHLPGVTLDFLLRKGNENLLQNHPYLNEVLIWDKRRKYQDLLRLLKVIRERRYDKVINLQRFGSTGMLTAFSNAAETIGFDKNPFSRFFSTRVAHRIEPMVHEVDRLAALVTSFTNERTFNPHLYPSVADYEQVKPYQDRPYICLAPTSVWFTKQYPEEKWIQFVRQIPDALTVYLLGAPSDGVACERIRQAAGRAQVVSLAGKLSLRASAALMQKAGMNYVNDSAPLHLASAMNAPTTAIFCSTVPEFGFGPLADRATIAQIDFELECRPCTLHGRKRCPLGHYACANQIPTGQLLAQLPA